jgi:hypothetical protein
VNDPDEQDRGAATANITGVLARVHVDDRVTGWWSRGQLASAAGAVWNTGQHTSVRHRASSGVSRGPTR